MSFLKFTLLLKNFYSCQFIFWYRLSLEYFRIPGVLWEYFQLGFIDKRSFTRQFLAACLLIGGFSSAMITSCACTRRDTNMLGKFSKQRSLHRKWFSIRDRIASFDIKFRFHLEIDTDEQNSAENDITEFIRLRVTVLTECVLASISTRFCCKITRLPSLRMLEMSTWTRGKLMGVRFSDIWTSYL